MTPASIAATTFLVEIAIGWRLSDRNAKRAAGYVAEVILRTETIIVVSKGG